MKRSDNGRTVARGRTLGSGITEGLGGRCGDGRRRKAAAVAVAVMMAVTLFPLVSWEPSAEGESGYERTVKYHRNHSSDDTVSADVTYAGIASAEYNPEFWYGDNGKENWDAPKFVYSEKGVELRFDVSQSSREDLEYHIKVPDGVTVSSVSCDKHTGGGSQTVTVDDTHTSVTVVSKPTIINYHWFTLTLTVDCKIIFDNVFAGWSDDKHPGDILEDVTELNAIWIEPDVMKKNDLSYDLSSGSFEIPDFILTEIPYGQDGDYTIIKNSDSVYGKIRTFQEDIVIDETLPPGVYRSADPDKPSTVTVKGNVGISGDVIIDNVVLYAEGENGANHGDGDGGLFANGNKLTIGTGVTAPDLSSERQYLQVYGGQFEGDAIDSTDVVIFSGTYYNVVAGSRGMTINHDTNLVMRGGLVLDTVIGGNSSQTSSTDGNTIGGSTHVYMLGDVVLPGDHYEEKALGNSDIFGNITRFTLNESTILTGGSNNGSITGDTFVHISNQAQLWDVQAGGRRGPSTVAGTAHAEVSGNALVKHILCGSITDGISDSNVGNNECVKNTSLVVKDGARVASVFGAGYDTYYAANYASMLNGGTISVSIEGGTVGYVYGGGYRGTIGTPDQPIGSIEISISGGTVLGDVFGGGRGGLDKTLHPTTSGDSKHNVSKQDSMGYSAVFADSISIRVTGGEIKGNLYGGGESVPLIKKYSGTALDEEANQILDDSRKPIQGMRVASVSSDVSIDVSGGVVGGGVYGAGKGVDPDDTVTVNGSTYHSTAFILAFGEDPNAGIVRIPWVGGTGGTEIEEDTAHYSNYASLTGNVTITMGDTSVGGSVFGGGMYGRTGSALTWVDDVVGGTSSDYTVRITLNDGTVVGGDVFAGGYGRANMLSTNLSSRTVIVDGAAVKGSVYGGSREGDDNCISPYGTGTTPGVGFAGFSRGDVYIYMVSGDIASGHSGNIYGGGYRGHSYMNTHIMVGVPAMGQTAEPVESEYDLSVRSVYGGPSVGDTSDFDNSVLLHGDTEIRIGSRNDVEHWSSPYRTFDITGDVFGEGDYCAVSGTSSVTFEGYSTTTPLLSVQKTGELTIVGSQIEVLGNVDGSTAQTSAKVSLNQVGDLVLRKHANWGLSTLTLHAAASEIGGYSSLDADGKVGEVPDLDSTRPQMNSIQMRDGMMISILGADNSGSAENVIRGYTLIDNGYSTYYGGFAMGTTARVAAGSTGFYVPREGGGYEMAQEAPYVINGNPVTLWYISGVYRVESTVELQDGDAPSKGVVVVAPKTVEGSTIRFVGGYVNPDSPGALDLVPVLGDGRGGREFRVMVGTPGGSLTIDTEGVAAMPASSYTFEGDGITIGIQVSTNKGFDTTGYAGTVVLHMVETIGSIPVNTFDAEVSIYLEMSFSSSGTISHDLVMRPSGDGYAGYTDVYLPVLPENGMAEYSVSLGGYAEGVWTSGSVNGGLTAEAVPTNLNKSGWQSIRTEGVNDVPTGERPEPVGVGGVFPPVLRFGYTCPGDTKFLDMTLTVWLVDEETGDTKAVYTLLLKPALAEVVDVTFYDQYLVYDSVSGTIEWSGHLEVFTIGVDFGTTLADTYVAVNDAYIGITDDTIVTVLGSDSAQSYIEKFGSNTLTVGDITEEILQTDGYGNVLAGTQGEINALKGEGFTGYSLMELLVNYTGIKNDTPYGEDAPFDYGMYPRFYDTSSCLSMFNFESKISSPSGIYAGYGIKISIVPFTDPDNPDAGGKEYTVMPSSFLQGLPGAEVDLDGLLGALSITPGYEPAENNRWYQKSGGRLEGIKIDESTKFTPKTDFTVYLMLERVRYGITLEFEGNVDGIVYDEYTVTVGTDVMADRKAYFGDRVDLSFTSDGSYHVGGVVGEAAGSLFDSFTVASGGGSNTLSFDMPAGDLVITVTMTDKKTITVNLPSGGVSDNGRLGVTLAEKDGAVVVGITVGGSSSATILSSLTTLKFEGGVGLGSGKYLVSVYEGSDEHAVLHDPSGVSVPMGDGISSTFSVYVSIVWDLTVSGDGYSVEHWKLNDPLTGSRVKVESPYKAGVHDVLTGDTLAAYSDAEGTVLVSLSYTNLRYSQNSPEGRLSYMVDGTGNPSLGMPTIRVALTVQLFFRVEGQPISVDEAPGPINAVTISSGDRTWGIYPSPTEGHLEAVVPVVNGEYTIGVAYDGYGPKSMEITVGSTGQTVKFDLDAIEYTLHIRDDAGSQERTCSWYVNNEDPISDIAGKGASGWFASPNDDMSPSRLLVPDSRIEVGMFAGTDLYILGVPYYMDTTQGPMTVSTVVVTTEDGINGTHQVAPVAGLKECTFEDEVDGSKVTVIYESTGTAATVTISGCPVGTGSLILAGEAEGYGTLVVRVYSTSDLEAVR